jgi:hypothetical protein
VLKNDYPNLNIIYHEVFSFFSGSNLKNEEILEELKFQKNFITNPSYTSATNGMNLLHLSISDFRSSEILECLLSEYNFDPNLPVEINEQIRKSRRYRREYEDEDEDEEEEEEVGESFFGKKFVPFFFYLFLFILFFIL